MDDKLKQFKGLSNYCAICKKECLFDGVTIPLVSLTESGNIIEPYNTSDSSMSAVLPLCPYHMVLGQNGLLAITTNNQIIFNKELPDIESKGDNVLRKLMNYIKNKRDNSSKACYYAMKTILEARKFQREFENKLSQEHKELKN